MSRLILAQGEGLELSGGDFTVVGAVAVVALAALAVGVVLMKEVLSADEGTATMKDIGRAVQEGATAYLNRQFKTLIPFIVVVFAVLFVLPAQDTGERIGRSAFFVVGALFSMTIGYLGMWLSTRANIRVASASNQANGRVKAMRIAFRTGGVVGMFTVGLGLFGAAVVVMVYAGQAPRVLEGFGFGAALLAMFMRVGGGIFTKAADVGGDLVGKIEEGIPEDDPRNAATIADNVGDNVGDCAGMAADLFESYAVTLVAALILGTAAFGLEGLLFPLIVPAIGVITAVIGVYATRVRPGEPGLRAINRSFYISAVISAIACSLAAFLYLPGEFRGLTGVTDIDGTPIAQVAGNPALVAAAAVIIGIVLAGVILWLTGYFTGTEHRPVKDVGESSLTGAATVILAGISIGFESAVYTALVIGGAVYGAFLLSGSVTVALFAVALAGTGLLTTVGVIVAMDTFGPVADNAQGIAEMSGDVQGEGVDTLTELDAVGNTTKAITKGIAIATAVLAATALFGSYRGAIRSAAADLNLGDLFNVSAPNVLVGIGIGAAVVFMFSGLAINAVSRAAGAVVFEVRRQFRDNPGIMEGTVRPEYGRVVDICTKDSLRELATPGLLAVLAPVAVGFGLGVGPLAGYLAGAIATGTLMAIFLANSGGAWDNGKKLIEDGNHGGKGSDAHAATIIGDTVGDPFKDTAGPSINPLIKVMNLVSVLIAPAIVTFSVGPDASDPIRITIALVAAAIIVTAVVIAKRRSTSIADTAPAEVTA